LDTDTDHDVTIAVGQCRNAGDTMNILHTLSGGITKQLDATWAAGHDAGGLNATDFAAGSSGIEADTTYHLYLIENGGGVVDAGFDKSITAANLLSDSGYVNYRRVASIVTNSTAAPDANILGYNQYGTHFVLQDPPTGSANSTLTSDTAITITLPGCPTGLSVLAECNAYIREDTNYEVYYSTLDQTDLQPSRTVAPYLQFAKDGGRSGRGFIIQTNTSAQFRIRPKANAGAFNTINVGCSGWFDDLGQYD